MNLYEINDALALWTPEVDEETGELLNGEALDELNAAREKKIEIIALWIKDLAAEIEAFKEE
ncbi:MAG: siphovirus Gp157 family protein [Oscillospiraceae bacterium]|nr:siphovirus Gp157 family protein [Oscillospiraceae bacterium]